MKYKRINASSNARLIRALMDSDLTCSELSEFVGLHYLTVTRFVRELHKHKVIHICEWRRDSRGCASERVFAFGESKDTKRPAALTSAERKRSAKIRNAHLAMVHASAGRLAA